MSQKFLIPISHIRRTVLTSHQRATAGNAVGSCINLHQRSVAAVLFDAGMSRLESSECSVIEQFSELWKFTAMIRFPSPAPLIINCLRNCAGKVQENQVCNLTYFWLFVQVVLTSQNSQNLGIEPDKNISHCIIVGHFRVGNSKPTGCAAQACRGSICGLKWF